MTPALSAACTRAIHVVKRDGTILRAGRATLFILEKLGWGWAARLLALPPFLWIVELGYRIFARNRPFFARFLFTRE
jgi:predicted DCC family thiol-disulfide oxidoreductase YuxK